MKIYPECIPCLLARVHYEAELSTDDMELQHKAIQAGVQWLYGEYRHNAPLTYISTGVHRRAYGVLGDDPYIAKKKMSNEIALKFLPAIRKIVESDSEGAFRRSIIASVIGNSFDFGVLGFEPEERFEDYFRQVFEKGLDVDDIDNMVCLLDEVLYLADNCGEIVFDGLVLDQIKRLGGHTTLVVKGAPILTDATLEDANDTGVSWKADRVLTTGSNAVGVNMDEAPHDLVEALHSSSLIISKGMANYESLSEYDFKPIAYLLRAKCEPIAKSLGVKKGWNVAKLCL
ncbi:MAG: ARMT1-like domain-containing protein [Methanocellales archaeon]|nr:ARMT1-like domain-containing protein [Methanocellales archaeon]MDD3291268.1 ARMT1-like domain-containing protein [Methanocellales archaeon]MDD5235440.1 ARMT1-like domain-containing protein [Methanocellales archaeon]